MLLSFFYTKSSTKISSNDYITFSSFSDPSNAEEIYVVSSVPNPSSIYSLFCENFSTYTANLSVYFLFALFASIVYCVFLLALRWNFLGGHTWLFKAFNQFPAKEIALFYSFFLFLLSALLCFTQFNDFVAAAPALRALTDHFLFLNWWEAPADAQLSLNELADRPEHIRYVPEGFLRYPFVWYAEHPAFFNSPHAKTGETIIYSGYRDDLHLFQVFTNQLIRGCDENNWFSFWAYNYLVFLTQARSLVSVDITLLQNLTEVYQQCGHFQYGLFTTSAVAPFFREAMTFAFSFDGLSLIFILLTTFITFLCICISWYSYRVEFHFTLILLLLITQFLIIIAFTTIDLILFYISFESVLIPLFFLVGIFGSRERRIKAAYYLMFYTLFGSIPFLIGLLYIWYKTGQTNILLLEPFLYGTFDQEELTFLWLLFLPGFAFKIPLYPFHLWLPEAHVEAPTVGSVILAGLVLKLGGYGFIRFSVGLLYWGGISYLNIVYWFCLFSMLCAVLCAACQIDLKRIIAYGSVGHMSLVTLCIFLGTQAGLESAMIMMLGHGFVSSALFILIGGLYERYHSRNVRYYGGLYRLLPRFGTFFFLFILFDIGVPGSPAFIAEFLAIVSVTQQSLLLAIFMSLPIIIGAGVSLLLCSRVIFGMNERRYFNSLQASVTNFTYWCKMQEDEVLSKIPATITQSAEPRAQHIIYATTSDFLTNETFVLASLFGSSLLLGVVPQIFLSKFGYDLETALLIGSWLI